MPVSSAEDPAVKSKSLEDGNTTYHYLSTIQNMRRERGLMNLHQLYSLSRTGKIQRDFVRSLSQFQKDEMHDILEERYFSSLSTNNEEPNM